jgi:alpha,alpha-trehalose phosphorylase
MLVPYDKDLEVHPQAEGFTQHQIWDFEHTTPDQYPLLLHFPYFDLYRKQVVKQADLVLALHLRGDAFSDEEKARNFDYYERLTVRDSSLSACTQAVIAAEVGQLDLAFDYLSEAALLDLNDTEHNTRDGLHIASLAGTWIAVVAGLGGMRDHDGVLSFAPRRPQALTRIAFRMCFCGRRLLVDVEHEQATYSLLEGDPLQIIHHGQPATVTGKRPLSLPISAPASHEPPSQPAGRAPEHRRSPS